MLKLTSNQLAAAVAAARDVAALERAKDAAGKLTYAFYIDDTQNAQRPHGIRIDLAMPAAQARAELSAMIAAAHTILRDLGIELVG